MRKTLSGEEISEITAFLNRHRDTLISDRVRRFFDELSDRSVSAVIENESALVIGVSIDIKGTKYTANLKSLSERSPLLLSKLLSAAGFTDLDKIKKEYGSSIRKVVINTNKTQRQRLTSAITEKNQDQLLASISSVIWTKKTQRAILKEFDIDSPWIIGLELITEHINPDSTVFKKGSDDKDRDDHIKRLKRVFFRFMNEKVDASRTDTLDLHKWTGVINNNKVTVAKNNFPLYMWLVSRLLPNITGIQIEKPFVLKTLPKEIVGFKKLISAEIRSVGLIAMEGRGIGSIKTLASLDLSGNKDLKDLQAVYGLSNLRKLNVSNTSVSRFAKSVEKMVSLEELNIGATKFTEIKSVSTTSKDRTSSNLLLLTSLEKLIISATSIRKIPSDISKLTKLKSIDIRSTKIKELPDNLFLLKNLETINLEDDFEISDNDIRKVVSLKGEKVFTPFSQADKKSALVFQLNKIPLIVNGKPNEQLSDIFTEVGVAPVISTPGRDDSLELTVRDDEEEDIEIDTNTDDDDEEGELTVKTPDIMIETKLNDKEVHHLYNMIKNIGNEMTTRRILHRLNGSIIRQMKKIKARERKTPKKDKKTTTKTELSGDIKKLPFDVALFLIKALDIDLSQNNELNKYVTDKTNENIKNFDQLTGNFNILIRNVHWTEKVQDQLLGIAVQFGRIVDMNKFHVLLPKLIYNDNIRKVIVKSYLGLKEETIKVKEDVIIDMGKFNVGGLSGDIGILMAKGPKSGISVQRKKKVINEALGLFIRILKFYADRDNVAIKSLTIIGGATFKRIPKEIAILQSLEELTINDNSKLSKMSRPSLSKLDDVVKVNLNNNAFTKIFSELTKMKNVKELSIRNNAIKNLPKDFGTLKKTLTKLDITGNSIIQLPKSIADLKKLGSRSLDIDSKVIIDGSIYQRIAANIPVKDPFVSSSRNTALAEAGKDIQPKKKKKGILSEEELDELLERK